MFFRNNPIVSNTLILISGTGAAQLLGIIFSPVFTRVYTPSDFGVFAVFTSLLSLLSVISSLRYEIAIPLPKNEAGGKYLLILCSLITLLLSAFSLIFALLSGKLIIDLLFQDVNSHILYFVPFSLLFLGLFKSAQYYSIRNDWYKVISFSKLTQSIPQIITQIIFGFLSLGPIGLILGDLIGKFLSCITLWINLLKNNIFLDLSFNRKILYKTAKRYKSFPLISSWSALISQAGLIIPTILLTALYGTTVSGWYALVQRVFAVPMDLIGQSIYSVYIAEFSKSDKTTIRKTFFRFFLFLFFLGSIPCLIIFFWGDVIFVVIFGREWFQAGNFAKVLSFAFLFRFAMSPLSQTLNLLEKQRVQLLWDILRLCLITSSIIICYKFNLNPVTTMIYYCCVVIFSQLLYFLLSMFYLNRI